MQSQDRFLDGGRRGVGNNTVVGSGASDWLFASSGNIIVIVANVKAKNGWVNVAVTPEEQETEDWLGEDVKNTVESGFGIRVDDIATLGKTPGNWVEEPQENGPDTTEQESAMHIGAEKKSVLTCNPEDVPCNTKKSNHAKNEVSPLVGRGHESTNKTNNNHDLIKE
jgi:hypothetical protein